MIDLTETEENSSPQNNVRTIAADNMVILKKLRLPNEYQELTYIGNSGTQWINTGLAARSNYKFYIRYQETTASGSNYAFGARGSGDNYYGGIGGGTNTHNVAVIYHSTTTPNSYRVIGNIYNITAEYTEAGTGTSRIECETTGDIFTGTQTTVFNNVATTVKVFAQRSSAKHSGMRVFEVKIWSDGVFERHLIPCKRVSDNVLGMYDLVHGVFYTNAGTGDFISGEINDTIEEIYPRTTAANVIMSSGETAEYAITALRQDMSSLKSKLYTDSLFMKDSQDNYLYDGDGDDKLNLVAVY